jgi:pyruvate/2-oxoglutarate/acetoin dehydrogenase E1 component
MIKDNKSANMRELAYSAAINEALHQAMGLCDDVIVMGQLVDYKSGIFGTTTGLVEKFGASRVQDMPVAEAMMTSVAGGAALAGSRPVVVHQRLDFMLYSMDAIVNWISLWYFKSNGKSRMPLTIRAITGKGWGQGPQHSKSFHSFFAHIPGLRVAMPSTAYDAKGILLESIFGENPTFIIEGRSLYSMKDQVPEEPYRVRFGEAIIRKNGKDVTLVAIGSTVPQALRVAHDMLKEGIDVEVIDPRTISPFDYATVCQSVHKTRKLVVIDPGWQFAGFAAEVITGVVEKMGDRLVKNPVRICLPDSHTPMSMSLEKTYYPDEEVISNKIRELQKN